MPASVTPLAVSQSRSASSSLVVVPNSFTSSALAPSSPGIRTQAMTVSLWTSNPAQRSTTTSIAPPFRRLALRGRPEEPPERESDVRARSDSSTCPRLPRHTEGRVRALQDQPTSLGGPRRERIHPLHVAARGQGTLRAKEFEALGRRGSLLELHC